MTSMSGSRFLPMIRELAQCFQAFESYSAAHIRSLGLTPPQFDIIATLGNQRDMSCKELAEQTLITKGTLTGVLDRLAAKGLLSRLPSPVDGRSWIVRLTAAGQALFEDVFPAHVAHLQPIFESYSDAELDALRTQFARLRHAFGENSPDNHQEENHP
ncbi:MarR family transcriptional regulator [Denitratisoma sp. DHT3]|nr:MarR family transcriptional regulator [Denitratisoma sp. DHT3]